MDGNFKLIVIILGIITLISLIFAIFGLVAYTKSNQNNLITNSSDNSQSEYISTSSTSDQEFCIPCSQKGGTSYVGVDGKSVPCNSIANYLTTPNGQTALIAAMAQIPAGDHGFKFNTDGNSNTTNKLKNSINLAGNSGWNGTQNISNFTVNSIRIADTLYWPGGYWQGSSSNKSIIGNGVWTSNGGRFQFRDHYS